MTPIEPRNPRALIAVMLVAAVGLMALDPYAWGSTGGESGLETFLWQMVVSALQVGLLGFLFVMVLRAQYRHALSLVFVEFLLLVGVNSVLILRDGTQRFLSGYAADSTVAWLLAGGIILRALVGLTIASRMRRKELPA